MQEVSQNDAPPSAEAAAKAAANSGGDLSPEQQQALGQIYQFLVQDMNSKARMDRNVSLQRLLETYQVHACRWISGLTPCQECWH